MLVASIICLPVMFAGINTYAYASDKGLAINDFWQICERHISYEDIESIETEYRASGDQTEYYFSYYITIENDEEIIDVLTYCSPEEMLFIHPEEIEGAYPIPAAFQTYTDQVNIRIGQEKYENQ